MNVDKNQPKRAVVPVPSLGQVVAEHGLDAELLDIGLEIGEGEDRPVNIRDRHSVPIHSGKEPAFWTAPPLREMFRGDRKPPSDSEMSHYPREYCDLFYFVENLVLLLCDTQGDRTDQELEEVYSTLRRRPDGKSLGPAHDFLWQVAALLLGKYEISALEFDAIFGQLARSARKWGQRPVSRNYVAYLRKMLQRSGG